MKRILFLVLVFVCFKSFGQLQRPNTRGYQLRNVIIDSFFAPPADTFSVPNDLRSFPFLATKGTSIYKWNTSSFVWQSISGGGGYSYTFSNGLTESAGTVKLGGTIGENTVIDNQDYQLDINGQSAATSRVWIRNQHDIQLLADAGTDNSHQILLGGNGSAYWYNNNNSNAETGISYLQRSSTDNRMQFIMYGGQAPPNLTWKDTMNQSNNLIGLERTRLGLRSDTMYWYTAKSVADTTGGWFPVVRNATTREMRPMTTWPNGGATPTLQQVLTAGSTLTTDNTIDVGGNLFTINNAGELRIYGDFVEVGYDGYSAVSAALGASSLKGGDVSRLSILYLSSDSMLLQPSFAKLNIDSLRTWSDISDTLYKKPMTWDTRNGRWEYAANWFGNGSASYTASNGLTLSGSNFKLGGTLGETTTITRDGFDLIVPDFDNFADTTNWKPVVINTTGSGASAGTLRKATYWPGGGGGSGITVGSTTITSGTSGRIGYNNAGVYGEKAVTGSGDVVLATSPTITTGFYVNDGANKLQVATNYFGADFISKSVRFQSSGNTYFKVTTNDESGTDPATTVTTVVTGKPGLRIVLTGSQTADAFQVHNSGGNTLADITKDGVLDLYNYGTAPSASVTNGIRLYAEDVSSSAELKVRDEAGNITTLSPHNFGKIPGGRSEKLAWSFYSERNGEYITADMTKALRTIEKQSAEIEELKAQLAELKGVIYQKKAPVKLVYKGKK